MFTSSLVTFLMATLVVAAPGVVLIGDSTVTDGAGWGNGFCTDTTGLARCVNLSVSGTTTISWQGQPQYSTMLSTCKNANTFATIQFGHNDQKVMDTATFAANLESLVGKVKAAGCSPILVTSLARRTFSGSTLTDILGPYSAQTIAVAKKLGLPLLPLLADSMAYVQKLGKAQAMQFNLDYSTTNKDTTHLNALGNRYFGRIVADEVKKTVPSLAGNIVADAALSAKIAAGTL
ncbi:SGNH hydrolase-type esterase domain-containing protein [Collybia nuda]|uniref:SGNH hydrolase-type esterase domain-containing protein n=1 Tax=Collybia nuda TaxID=64659 RepID=A0A9P5XRJ1_9AGAR|nr:SGNH hydrolase-type esterase domain-containing protein [Collybia nuda]KAF9456464.1 SGNH hydrolase-type esterase domain-containing protein [Collybia nuda]